jgi:hypothetical protein
MTDNRLHVATCLFNPMEYKQIYANYARFAAAMEANPNVVLYTIEAAFGTRAHRVTDAANPRHFQVRANSQIWLKENLCNLAFQRFEPTWEFGAWIDADVLFLDPEWADKTIHALNRYKVVQPWSEALYTGPHGEFVGYSKSFASMYSKGLPYPGNPPTYGAELWHPGFAWAITRPAFEGLGGLFDVALIGQGDNHMSLAFIGEAEKSLKAGLSDDYKAHLMRYEARAERHVMRRLGHVNGMVHHLWHGRQVGRQYQARWTIPINHGLRPSEHIVRNSHGVYGLSDDTPPEHVRAYADYFSSRNDDANTKD